MAINRLIWSHSLCAHLNGDVGKVSLVERVPVLILVHWRTPQEVFVKVEHDRADLQGPLAHDPTELDARQFEVLVPDGLHLSVAVEAGVEFQHSLQLGPILKTFLP